MQVIFTTNRYLIRLCRVRTFSTVTGLRKQKKKKDSITNATGVGALSNDSLKWADFFKLRKQETRINTCSSIFTALSGVSVSWTYLSNMQIDPTQMIFGFDPLLMICVGLVASGGLGYLFGPLLGSTIFNMKNKKIMPTYNRKNKDFLEHIKKNRVDASSQSFSNPVPDYYGEKIGSLNEYRQWLRDCNSHRTKAKEFV